MDPEQLRQRAYEATGHDPANQHQWDAAEKVGAFAAGFLLAQATQPQQPGTQRPSWGQRIARALFFSLWAYFIYFVGGAIVLMVLVPLITK